MLLAYYCNVCLVPTCIKYNAMHKVKCNVQSIVWCIMYNIITLSIYSFCLSLVIWPTTTWVGLLAVHQDRETPSRDADGTQKITNFWFEAQGALRLQLRSVCVIIDFSANATERNGTRLVTYFSCVWPRLRLRSVCARIDFSANVVVTLRGWYSAASTLRPLTAALRSSEVLGIASPCDLGSPHVC